MKFLERPNKQKPSLLCLWLYSATPIPKGRGRRPARAPLDLTLLRALNKGFTRLETALVASVPVCEEGDGRRSRKGAGG